MSFNESPPVNPYQAPAACPPLSESDPHVWISDKLASFRQQIHALGGAWILFGLFLLQVSVTAATMDFQRERFAAAVFGYMMGAIGLAWIGAGIAACWKMIRAVHVGLGIHFLLVGILVFMDGLNAAVLAVLTVFFLIQARRVIRWAKELTGAGISLTACYYDCARR